MCLRGQFRQHYEALNSFKDTLCADLSSFISPVHIKEEEAFFKIKIIISHFYITVIEALFYSKFTYHCEV